MSKKHFQRLAWELAQVEPSPVEHGEYVWLKCCYAVADVCGFSDENFDRDRFLSACHREWWAGKKPPK